MKGGAKFPVRLQYSKRGKVRFISHRDVARAFERAFRIEQLPLAFSEGFSPHPKVSFGLALATGVESDAEYLDVELVDAIDLDALPAALTAALPSGLSVLCAVPLAERAPALQEVVTAVEWDIEVGADDGPLTPAELRDTVAAALASPVLPTRRRRKGKEITEDVRPAIRDFDVIDAVEGHGVRAHLELNTQPRSAKPDEVLAAITGTAGGRALVLRRAVRTHQWIERDGARQQPLDADTRPGIVTDDPATREGSNVRTPNTRDHRTADPVAVAGGILG